MKTYFIKSKFNDTSMLNKQFITAFALYFIFFALYFHYKITFTYTSL